MLKLKKLEKSRREISEKLTKVTEESKASTPMFSAWTSGVSLKEIDKTKMRGKLRKGANFKGFWKSIDIL